MPKITSGGASNGWADGPHEHPGYGGVQMHAAEHPADGTSAEVSSEGGGEPGEQVTQLPPGEFAAPEPIAPPPPVSAPKADHVAYVAGALGVPEDEAAEMTKADLVDLAKQAAAAPAQPDAPATEPAAASNEPPAPARPAEPPSGPPGAM